jgi:hypothetical protein
MNDATLTRDQVRAAIGMEWPSFEARHPNLAGLLDQDAVVERAATYLAHDPEYKKAMDEATAIGMGAQAASQMIRGFIQDWMQRLIF